MDGRVSMFISILFLASTVGALRSCVEVQNTLMACVMSSDVPLVPDSGPDLDVEKMCWHISVLLECVADAKSTCPNLPVLSDPDFARGVEMMETSHDTYCNVSAASTTTTTPEPTTSSSMLGDQAESSESCDPLNAMLACNDVMANVTPGDIKAMCGPGEEYLQCMTHIVDTCPSHVEALPFDLQLAINTTKTILERECPAVAENERCSEMIYNAKRGCADFLTDGNGDYCKSLLTYMECLDITLMECPDDDLKSVLASQYQHHCVQASPQRSQDGGNSECPDDIEASIMECTSHVNDMQNSDKATFCRKAKKYLRCMKDLIGRCENDSRLAMLPSVPLKQLRQQIKSVCDAKEDVRQLQPKPRTRNPLSLRSLPQFP
ncbi:hypothetical protein ACOMHN_039603 [Nucella lapillus]